MFCLPKLQMCEMKSLKHFLHRETLSNYMALHRISNLLLEMFCNENLFLSGSNDR
jgi:hypothetical protein